MQHVAWQPRQVQFYEYTPYRGYMSSVESMAHFGLDTSAQVDSVVIIWPGQRRQVGNNVKADQKLAITETEKNSSPLEPATVPVAESLLTDITETSGIEHTASEVDFIDFNIIHINTRVPKRAST